MTNMVQIIMEVPIRIQNSAFKLAFDRCHCDGDTYKKRDDPAPVLDSLDSDTDAKVPIAPPRTDANLGTVCVEFGDVEFNAKKPCLIVVNCVFMTVAAAVFTGLKRKSCSCI
jgi:hypothetical protein